GDRGNRHLFSRDRLRKVTLPSSVPLLRDSNRVWNKNQSKQEECAHGFEFHGGEYTSIRPIRRFWKTEFALLLILPFGTIQRTIKRMIKEQTDYGSDQTQNIKNGRRRDGDGRSPERVCSADWARRACVLLRKRSRSHPL